MAKKELFFWSIIPSTPYVDKLESLKQQISQEYRTYKALNSPPHITLIPPTRLTTDQKATLGARIEEVCSNHQPFNLKLTGFGHFGSKVLFITVQMNEHLESLHEDLMKVYEAKGFSSDHDIFRPHLTLANRDISRAQFHRAWNDLKGREYRMEFPVQSLFCLEHNGKNWDIQEVTSLSGGRTTY